MQINPRDRAVASLEKADRALSNFERIMAFKEKQAVEAAVRQLEARGGRLDS